MQLQQAIITTQKPGERVRAEREIDPKEGGGAREGIPARMIQPPGR